MTSLVRALVRGAVAGVVATVPMSAVMLAAQRAGAVPKQPPEEIVDSALDAADVDADEEISNVLATLHHFAFGAIAGAGYSALRHLAGGRGSGPASGIVYALAVWFASYQEWVPRITPLPPVTQDRDDRQAVMAGAHMVYGAVLGVLTRRAN